MKAFLSGNRFDAIGIRERGDSWWLFRNNGTFEARHGRTHLRGRWAASINELSLTTLELATDGGRSQAMPDRKCRLEWQDGKMNINIDGRQYRNYGINLRFPRNVQQHSLEGVEVGVSVGDESYVHGPGPPPCRTLRVGARHLGHRQKPVGGRKEGRRGRQG
jgi:hypothetical protein